MSKALILEKMTSCIPIMIGICLDTHLLTKGYGKRFMASLPIKLK